MTTYQVCVTAVADAMLLRGFGELLAPEALDDGPPLPVIPANAQTPIARHRRP
jgi:hypothetical protein